MTTGIHLRQWHFAPVSMKPPRSSVVSGSSDWNHYTELGAFAVGSVVHFDRAAGRRDEVAAHRETEARARARCLRREERIEDASAITRRNAWTVVRHAQLRRDPACRRTRRDRDRAAGVAHRLGGVLHEIDEDLLQRV